MKQKKRGDEGNAEGSGSRQDKKKNNSWIASGLEEGHIETITTTTGSINDETTTGLTLLTVKVGLE